MTRITSSQWPSTCVSNAYIQLSIFSIGNIIRDQGSKQVVPERRRKKRGGTHQPSSQQNASYTLAHLLVGAAVPLQPLQLRRV